MKKFLTGIALALAIVSCGGSESTSSNKEVTFTYNLVSEGKSIDSSLATSSTSIEVNALISEGLTKIGKDKNIQAGLAKSWDISEDGLTWTFHLRDGLKWSNGDKLTANDFKFAWLRALDPNTASEYAYMLYNYIKGAQAYNEGKGSADDVAIKVLDDKTLQVTLTDTVPYFESLVSFVTYLPINEKFYREKGDNYALEASDIVSSGPYILKSWTHNSDMVFVKNPNYYDAKNIKIDKIVTKFISDVNAELNAFKNGEFDFAEIKAEQYEEFKNDDRLVKVPVATTFYLQYNTINKFLSNKNIRKAILMAIDKEDIVQNIFRNANSAAYTLTPRGLGIDSTGKDFVDMVGEVVPKYNVKEAKEYFAKGLKELGLSKAPEISLILSDTETAKKLGEYIQENLRKNLGLTINIELMAFKERLARTSAKNFDIVLSGWGADYQDPMTFLDLFITNGGNNNTSFSSKEYDKLIKIARTTNDPKIRFEAFKKAEEILADEVPIAVLYNKNCYYLIDNRFTGYVFPSVGADKIFKYLELKK